MHTNLIFHDSYNKIYRSDAIPEVDKEKTLRERRN